MSGATGLGAGDGTLPDLDTPDYTDSESNPTGTANSVVGDAAPADGRKRRWEGNALRKTVLGKKHDRLGESTFHRYEPEPEDQRDHAGD
jgi:SWI/SNF-related matrix-associated actin-dependent regulator of chromatin subfamily A member 5